MAWTRRSLRGRIRVLEAQVAELRAQRESLCRSVADEPPRAEDDGHGRRAFLRLGAAGAIGALGAVLADGRPAAALDPDDVTRNTSNTVTSPTSLLGTFNNPVIIARNESAGTGAAGIVARSLGPRAGAVRGENLAQDGYAVTGFAFNGSDFAAIGSGVCSMTNHTRAATAFHRAGDIFQVDGVLQSVVLTGTPGVARVLAGPATAGAMHVLDNPTRIYDSRPGEPPLPVVKGPLASHEERVIDAKAGFTVPAGATAVVVNLTVVSASPKGFLAAFPNGVAWRGNSSINWDHIDQLIANSAIVKVDANALFRVRANNTTHVVIDALGYFR